MSEKGRTFNDPRPYLVRIKRGFLAAVEGGQEAEITDEPTIKQIEDLLEERRKAGQELSKLIVARGVTHAGVQNATKTLGAGD